MTAVRYGADACRVCQRPLNTPPHLACAPCGQRYHLECCERTACLDCGARLASSRGTYAEALEEVDGRLARVGLGGGAALGALVGWLLLPVDVWDAEPWAVALASAIRGGITGFVFGPFVVFALRAWLAPVDEEAVDWGYAEPTNLDAEPTNLDAEPTNLDAEADRSGRPPA